MKNDIWNLVKSVHQEMIDCRRDLHMHPEIGFDLERTAGIVAQELKKYGLSVKTGVGKTGVVADLLIPGAKKWIALRADMDALPMNELNDVPYKSQVTMRAHMCGHDAHTAMLLGAAKILSSIRDELTANIRFIFQPNEEQFPGGAPLMIQEGVLEGINEIYALHVWPLLPVGQYGICVGPAMAQPDGFKIVISGIGGHAAAPHLTIDPILIAAQLIQSLQTIVSRNVDPLQSAVVTVSQINAGTANNVIPDSCTLSGTVRTYDKSLQKAIRKRIEDIVRMTVEMHGAKMTLEYIEGYPVTFNDETLAHEVRTVARSLVSDDNVIFPGVKSMGGEDFAYYVEHVKGCYIFLGCRNEAKGFVNMCHDPRFDLDEECLMHGTALHVALALKS